MRDWGTNWAAAIMSPDPDLVATDKKANAVLDGITHTLKAEAGCSGVALAADIP